MELDYSLVNWYCTKIQVADKVEITGMNKRYIFGNLFFPYLKLMISWLYIFFSF